MIYKKDLHAEKINAFFRTCPACGIQFFTEVLNKAYCTRKCYEHILNVNNRVNTYIVKKQSKINFE